MMMLAPAVVVVTVILGTFLLFVARILNRPRKTTHPAPLPFATVLPPRQGPYDLDELFNRLGTNRQDQATTEPRYREVRIPKRRGGTRKLHIPDSATKVTQRRILRRLLQRLKSHDAAMGFEKGKSIRDHAQRHIRSQVIVNLDLVDFFPSTHHQRVNAFFQRVGWNREAARWLTTWTCHDQGLPQGAPTSPRLSNLINRLMDQQLSQCALQQGFRYSRYADDLTFSFPQESESPSPNAKDIRNLTRTIKRIVRGFGYRLHPQKQRVRRAHQQQRVTGLVVNQKVQLPRETRRWLRAVNHRHRMGKAASLSTAQLLGWNALQQMLGNAPSSHVQSFDPRPFQSDTKVEVSATELSSSQLSEAIELIQRAAYRSSERDVFIQGLTGVSATLSGAIQENLPTLSSATQGTIYHGGRTIVIQLDDHGPLVEVLITEQDAGSVSRWMYGEQRTLQGTVARWNDRFDRAQVECPSVDSPLR